MTNEPLDLEAIKARMSSSYYPSTLRVDAAEDDLAALIAEVERLRVVLSSLDDRLSTRPSSGAPDDVVEILARYRADV